MNVSTQVSPNGDIAIPQDVRDRLRWQPGTPLDLVETAEGISLRSPGSGRPKPCKTLADLDALPTYAGPAQSVDAISSLSDDDLRHLFG